MSSIQASALVRSRIQVASRLRHLSLLVWTLVLACGCGDEGKKMSVDVGPHLTLVCDSDRECASGRCDPLLGCVVCLFDTDCGADERCSARRCEPILPCRTQAECASGRCDRDREECVECLSSTDCGASQRCSNSRCVAYQSCRSERDCANGLHCDLSGGECLACRNDKDCTAEQSCQNHECVPRCARAADCPARLPYCGPAGVCSECLAHTDCPGVYHCAADRCALDVCDTHAGESCSRSGASIQRCNEVGDGYDLERCPASSICSSDATGARCQPQLCTPQRWSCDRTNRFAERCSPRGDALDARVECDESSRCVDGRCAPLVCEPGTRRCALRADTGVTNDSDAVIVCGPLGTEQSIESCAPTEYCDPGLGACAPMRCVPGELACSAETITQCAPDGSRVDTTDTDCAAAGQACWAGACLARVCNGEGSLLCVDGNSLTCKDNGTRLALQETCGLDHGTYCDLAKGTCRSFTCEPAQPLCNGELATSCKNDGSGPRETGIDCAAKGKVCWDGECLPVVCGAAYQCSAKGELLRCDKHGTALVVEKNCGSDPDEPTVCDADAGTCRLQKCPPSQPACNGNAATTCDATGLDFDPLAPVVDCSATQAACVDGTCRPIICSPHVTYCAASQATGATESIAATELRRCDATGTASTLVATCGDAEFCRAGEATCLPRVCSPGSLICAGTVLSHCAADGSGPSPSSGDTDCAATSQACDLGACRPIVCAPNQRLCQDNDVYVCNTAGTHAAVYDNCDPREYCDAPTTRPQDTACKPDLCIASRPACAGETLASCNPDGSNTENRTLDCSLNSQVCDLRGACVDQAFDAVAPNATESFAPTSATIHFALLRVTTTRRLAQLAIPVTIPGAGAHTISWFVYRSAFQQGPYARIVSAAGNASENATLVTWSPGNFVLEANSFYLLGVSVSEPHQVGVANGATPQPIGFGQILGGYTLTVTGPAPDEMRIGAGEGADSVGVSFSTVLAK